MQERFRGGQTRPCADRLGTPSTGSSGIIVRLSTNHFRLTSRPQWALYQYHIDYSPLMEARRLRSALLFQHEDLIGRCHAFDGTILFLPKRLQHKVTSDVRAGGRGGGPHFPAKQPRPGGTARATPGRCLEDTLSLNHPDSTEYLNGDSWAQCQPLTTLPIALFCSFYNFSALFTVAL